MRLFAAVRWLVRLEIGIWRSLFLWVTRRKPGQGPGVQAFPYSRDLAPIIAAFLLGSTLELVVVHLLLPWETIRLVLDIVSLWGLLWMLGYLASVRVFPHLVTEAGLRVRYGTTVDIAVPWEAVASVSSQRRSVPDRKALSIERDVASVAVLKQTKVDVTLHGPTALGLPVEVSELRLYVDNPRAFVTAARERLASPA